ncbi:MAG: NAD(P)H-dependent oxidoreductase [Nitrososphaerota archaeon]
MNRKIKEIYIPIILGTARKGRESEKVANFILKEAIKIGLQTELIDVKDYRIEATDRTKKSIQAQKFAEKINKANGLIIITPEYNHSYPGELKMMLDMLYEEYEGKPVGLCGVSSGSFGGARAIEQLILLCNALCMLPIRRKLYFPKVQDLFNEKGNIKDTSYYPLVKNFLEELINYAKKIKE